MGQGRPGRGRHTCQQGREAGLPHVALWLAHLHEHRLQLLFGSESQSLVVIVTVNDDQAVALM